MRITYNTLDKLCENVAKHHGIPHGEYDKSYKPIRNGLHISNECGVYHVRKMADDGGTWVKDVSPGGSAREIWMYLRGMLDIKCKGGIQ